MSGYLINFIVYTTAMVGIIFLAVIVYKNFSAGASSKSKFLNVEDCINLAPRKNLYVIRAGEEKFLVASDVDRTCLISKLDDDNKKIDSKIDDLPDIIDFQMKKESKKVFKNIINNIRN